MKTTFYFLVFNSFKGVLLKSFFFLFLFQFSVVKAQNPILLDHTWYFEIGSVSNETFIIPNLPEDFPGNTLFESKLDFYIENANILFTLSHYYCSMFPYVNANFSDNESTFSITDYVSTIGDGCDFSEADFFLGKVMYFYGILFEQIPNPFSYTIESVDNYYKLTITNNDGDWLVYNSILLSNSTFNENTVSLFPNPVQNILNIQNTASNLSKVQIFDLNGRLLQNHDLQSQEVSLDVSGLQSGVYLVVLENEMGNQITRKIVKN